MAKAAYYATIPAPVRYCKELEPNAKLLYGELTALSEQEGYCWATNAHFAELYDVDIRTVKRWLESLKKQKFISIDADEKGDRRIWISPEIKKVFMRDKNGTGGGQKCPPDNISKCISSNSNAASQLSDFLLTKIKSMKPDFTKGVSPKWIKDFQNLLKLRSEDQIKKIIEWIFESSFWQTIIHSPGNLIKNIDKIEMQMSKTSGGNGSKEWINKLKEKVKDSNEIFLSANDITFSCGQSCINIRFTDHGYQQQILNRLRLMKISTDGL